MRSWSGAATPEGGGGSADPAAAQPSRGVDADRLQEVQVPAVDLESGLARGRPARPGQGERLGVLDLALAIHQEVERVALLADLAQRAVDLRRLRDGLGEGAPQIAQHRMELVVQLEVPPALYWMEPRRLSPSSHGVSN